MLPKKRKRKGELCFDLWREVMKFFRPIDLYQNGVSFVCREFKEIVDSLGLKVVVDLRYHSKNVLQCSSTSQEKENIPNEENQHLSLFSNVLMKLHPPPNPFHYPLYNIEEATKAQQKPSLSNNRSRRSCAFDVHCCVDIFEEDWEAYCRVSDISNFKALLKKYLREEYFGMAAIGLMVLRAPSSLPFSDCIDVLQYEAPKSEKAMPTSRDHLMHQAAELTIDITSISKLKNTLPSPSPHLRYLKLFIDFGCLLADKEAISKCLFGFCNLDVLSLNYFFSAHHDMQASSEVDKYKFGTSHLSLVCERADQANILRKTLSREVESLELDQSNITAFFAELSDFRGFCTLAGTTIRCLVVKVSDLDALTFAYVFRTIGDASSKLKSLQWLIFDIGDNYNDCAEQGKFIDVIFAAKHFFQNSFGRTFFNIDVDYEL